MRSLETAKRGEKGGETRVCLCFFLVVVDEKWFFRKTIETVFFLSNSLAFAGPLPERTAALSISIHSRRE